MRSMQRIACNVLRVSARLWLWEGPQGEGSAPGCGPGRPARMLLPHPSPRPDASQSSRPSTPSHSPQGHALLAAPADEIDLGGLEARALAWREEASRLRAALEAPDFSPPPEVDQDAPVTADSAFASALGGPAAALLASWEADVLPLLAGHQVAMEEEIAGKLEELAGIREARAQAQAQVQGCLERRKAAAAALDRAMALDLEEEALTPRDASAAPEERKKRKGWGKKLMGKMHMKKSSHTEKGGGAGGGAAGERGDDPIETANDALVQSSEDLEVATEELDRLTRMCLDLSEALQDRFSEEELAHSRRVRGAVRGAAAALEGWAEQALAAIAPLQAEGFDERSDGSLDAPSPGPDAHCDSSLSTSDGEGSAPDDLTCAAAERLERRVGRAAERNEALRRSLPWHRGLGQEEDQDDDGRGPPDEEDLWRLAKENAELEERLGPLSAQLLRRSLEQSCANLDREVSALEDFACACVELGEERRCEQRRLGAASQRPGEAGGDRQTPWASGPKAGGAGPSSHSASSRGSTPKGLTPQGSPRASEAAGLPQSPGSRALVRVTPPQDGPAAGVGCQAPVRRPQPQALDLSLRSSELSLPCSSQPSSKPLVSPAFGEGSRIAEEPISPTHSADTLREAPADEAAEDGGARPREASKDAPRPDRSPSPSSAATFGTERRAASKDARRGLDRSPSPGSGTSLPPKEHSFAACTPSPDHSEAGVDERLARLAILRLAGDEPHQESALERGTPRQAIAPRPERVPPSSWAAADPEVRKVFGVDAMEVALARSDATLHDGRLGEQGAGYWNWEWRDCAAEELHCELQRCSHGLANLLTDDDWSLFAYELLLLAHARLPEGDPALESVRAFLPICRVSLGISSLLHHHIAELTLGDAGACFPLDVRFRAALLLRSWVRAEAACFGADTLGGSSAQWTTAWVRRQLAVLRGSAILRALALQREGLAATEKCASCVGILRELDAIAAAGSWGHARPPDRLSEVGGRRMLVTLMQDLDAMRPAAGHWTFGTIFAAKVFSRLWTAATDEDAEDRVSFNAPVVATALLSGLHPHIGTVPLQLETHALLLAQQLWLALATRALGSPFAGSHQASVQLPLRALQACASVLDDFPKWLHRLSVNTAACFARRTGELCGDEAAELTARRLLTVELRDGLVQTLVDYRRHLEPEAFASALSVWTQAHRATLRSELLVEAAREAADGSLLAVEVEDYEVFVRRISHWFIYRSVLALAELSLRDFDSPAQVHSASVSEWQKFGPRIKKHLEGLAAAVQALLDELECERKLYHQPWEDCTLGPDHLGITTAALVSAALKGGEGGRAARRPGAPSEVVRSCGFAYEVQNQVRSQIVQSPWARLLGASARGGARGVRHVADGGLPDRGDPRWRRPPAEGAGDARPPRQQVAGAARAAPHGDPRGHRAAPRQRGPQRQLHAAGPQGEPLV